jgi:hypothetical protein
MKSTSEIADSYIKWMKRILIFTFVMFLMSLASDSRFVDKLEGLWNIFFPLACIATAKLLIHHWINQVRRGNIASQSDDMYMPETDHHEDAMNGHKIHDDDPWYEDY